MACTNLAWKPDDEDAALNTLAKLGYTGVEIAPTRFCEDGIHSSLGNAKAYRLRLADRGFSIPSMQAIYYGLDGVSLFNPDTHDKLIDRTFAVARLAEAFECPVLVFGAPRMRDPGRVVDENVINQADEILSRLAQIALDYGTTLCIEPNARDYGCRFVWTVKQAIELVERIGHPGFGLHVDAAAMFMEGEDGPSSIRAYAPKIRHFHVSEPQLSGLATPKVDHLANLAALAESGYDGWISLESTDAAAFDSSVSTLSSWIHQC